MACTEKVGCGTTEGGAGTLFAGLTDGSAAIGIGGTATDFVGSPGSGGSVKVYVWVHATGSVSVSSVNF